MGPIAWIVVIALGVALGIALKDLALPMLGLGVRIVAVVAYVAFAVWWLFGGGAAVFAVWLGTWPHWALYLGASVFLVGCPLALILIGRAHKNRINRASDDP